MINGDKNTLEALKAVALERSNGFCYGCYVKAASVDNREVCPKCGSDDLMRELDGVGVEYGLDWVVEAIVKEECDVIDIVEAYRDMLDECYEPISIGSLKYLPSQVLEAVDPVAFRIGCSEYADSMLEDSDVVEIDGLYYGVWGLLQ